MHVDMYVHMYMHIDINIHTCEAGFSGEINKLNIPIIVSIKSDMFVSIYIRYV
jgi:hypothetical protein